MVYVGVDDMDRPMQKSQDWLAKWDLAALDLRCQRPRASAGATHGHRQIRGTMKTVEGTWVMRCLTH
jgi:hypothetical protein